MAAWGGPVSSVYTELLHLPTSDARTCLLAAAPRLMGSPALSLGCPAFPAASDKGRRPREYVLLRVLEVTSEPRHWC
ncbi:rCG20103 [Rattus norvegicus]|uniref:RCG20103 n=1 Tax=Rattus norvegicus TaxID=10116 RepID=A6JG50_RAT|nr:rCG20103 [Rattus norvegicus]